MRYQDPEGDYGRQKRQREVIQKVVEKVLSLNSVSHYQSILKALSTNIDLSAKSIPSLLGYKDSFKTIETQQLKGEGEMLQGVSYQIVTRNHMLEMQNLLRRSLGQEEVTQLETNVVLFEDLFGRVPVSDEDN